ncbi:MAG TPA: hypothetical protein VI753_06510 [Anaerolineales bacterium]|nr:hypothetical protein [Anaerolineales bacterium]
MDMPDENKRTFHADYWRETFFLPPLKMILSVFDKDSRQNEPMKKDAEKPEDSPEKTVTKLIEKLSEKDD